MAAKYPAMDESFFVWGTNMGMTDAQIAEDWEAYCDDLVRFHEEISLVMGEPTPAPSICLGGSD